MSKGMLFPGTLKTSSLLLHFSLISYSS